MRCPRNFCRIGCVAEGAWRNGPLIWTESNGWLALSALSARENGRPDTHTIVANAARGPGPDGWAINVKRTYRVYREEGRMVRKRRRKKLPVPERQPLVRPSPQVNNEVWSMDFVFDELANGRRV
jgi:hypothetical protein